MYTFLEMIVDEKFHGDLNMSNFSIFGANGLYVIDYGFSPPC